MITKKTVRLIAAIALSLVFFICFTARTARAEAEYPADIRESEEQELEDKIVILHSNDVHGAIEGYAKMSELRQMYEDMGAQVILADAGDFSQGDINVSYSKGSDAVHMMNEAGYTIAAPGNHDLDFGRDKLKANLEDAMFKTVCANVLADGKPLYDPSFIFDAANGVRIGFFGLTTPETKQQTKPELVRGLDFLSSEDMYDCAAAQTEKLRSEGADLVIGLTHLGVNKASLIEGNGSADLYQNVPGIDLLIDGHSHTVMTEGLKGEPIQSTGTKFKYIGAVIIDDTGRIEDRYLISTEGLEEDPAVLQAAKEIEDKINRIYGKVFASSETEFNGNEDANKSIETNNGDLITDAMLWYVRNHPEEVGTDMDHVLVIENGGSLRNKIPEGNITRKDIVAVHPFENTLTAIYVTGKDLLEALEAATFLTPEPVGGYPQTAGIKFSIDTTKEYDAGEPYPDSVYNRPASIQRVSIDSINGKPFDENAGYTVITNDFIAQGGDTYYVFSQKEQKPLGVVFDQLLIDYITDELGGVLTKEKYGKARGDVTVITADNAINTEETGEELQGNGADLVNDERMDEASAQNDASVPDSYTVVKGDCLWKIAEKQLGDGSRWAEIYELNKGAIKDPSLIYPGQVFKLPQKAA